MSRLTFFSDGMGSRPTAARAGFGPPGAFPTKPVRPQYPSGPDPNQGVPGLPQPPSGPRYPTPSPTPKPPPGTVVVRPDGGTDVYNPDGSVTQTVPPGGERSIGGLPGSAVAEGINQVVNDALLIGGLAGPGMAGTAGPGRPAPDGRPGGVLRPKPPGRAFPEGLPGVPPGREPPTLLPPPRPIAGPPATGRPAPSGPTPGPLSPRNPVDEVFNPSTGGVQYVPYPRSPPSRPAPPPTPGGPVLLPPGSVVPRGLPNAPQEGVGTDPIFAGLPPSHIEVPPLSGGGFDYFPAARPGSRPGGPAAGGGAGGAAPGGGDLNRSGL